MKRETGSGYMPRLLYAMLVALSSLLSTAVEQPTEDSQTNTAIRYKNQFTCETVPVYTLGPNSVCLAVWLAIRLLAERSPTLCGTG